MRHARTALILSIALGACGCTTGPMPVRDLGRDPAVGSAQTSFDFGRQRNSLNSPAARNGMIMPDPGADQMPQSRNSLP